MRRVVIINDASTARGGATGLALLQARLLRDRGVDVVFAAADDGDNPELGALGVRLYAAGSEPLMKLPPHVAATRGLYNRAIRTMLERVIAAEDSSETVYHVHSWSKTLTPAVFSALQGVAARTFIHAHDFFLACPNGGFMDYRAGQPCDRVPLSPACLVRNCDKRSYAQKAWRVSRQVLLRGALPRSAPWAAILLIHPTMAAYLTRSGYTASQLVTLRNPATALSKTRIRAEDNERFLFIGRVEAEKGVEDLVTASIAAGVPLTVAGDGPLREELAEKYPTVHFTGWLDRAGLMDEAQSSRALVMPSRYPEPFGLVAAEASLSGLPVVTSSTAFLGEEIAQGGIGLVADTQDPAAFAQLIRQVAELPRAAIREMSEQAASGAVGLCNSPASWIDNLLMLYAQACGGSTSADSSQ